MVSYAATLSTIPERSEPLENSTFDKALLSPSVYIVPGSFAYNSTRHRRSSMLSVSTISIGSHAISDNLPLYSPWSSTSEPYFKDGRLSYNSVGIPTTFSVFDAYQEAGIANDPIRITAELEMYVPVTSAMIHILLTKGHLFQGHEPNATRLARCLETSCDEVTAFLSVLCGSIITPLHGSPSSGCSDDFPARMEPAGHFHGCVYSMDGETMGAARREVNVKPRRSHRSVRRILRSGKRNLKCKLANLILRIPSRGPRWLMDRVLLWTIVGDHGQFQRNSSERTMLGSVSTGHE